MQKESPIFISQRNYVDKDERNGMYISLETSFGAKCRTDIQGVNNILL